MAKSVKSTQSTVKTSTMLDIARCAKAEEMLNLFAKQDQANGFNTRNAHDLLEVMLYDKFIQANEMEGVDVNLSFSDLKTLRVIAYQMPYILGVESFSLSYCKSNKQVSLTAVMKTPYGNYRDSLEMNGLLFNTNNNKEVEQVRNAEQLEVIQEIETLASSMGLSISIH